MKRKLIQMGGKTMVVSLPFEWVKKYGLKKGEEIDVEEEGRRLVITTSKEYGVEKVKVNLKGTTERVIRWTLGALHKSGYDEIILEHDEKKTVDIIEEMVKDLFTGFTIMEQTKDHCVLKRISQDLESEFEPTLRRAFLVTLSMGEESLDCIKNQNFKGLKDLIQKEHVNNQLTNFCERLLNKKGYTDYKKTCFMYVIAWNLEKVCDNYKDICELLKDVKKMEVKKDIIRLYEQTNGFFKSYYELFYNFDIIKLSELTVKRKEIEKDARKMVKGKSELEIELIDYLLGVVLHTKDFSATMIAINQKV